MSEQDSPDTEQGDADDKGAGKSSRLTDAQFAEICEAYELGLKGMAELADECGVTRQTLSRRFKDAKIVKGSRAHELKQAVKQGAQAAAKAAGERYQDKRQEWIEETRVQGYKTVTMLRNLQLKRVRDAVTASTPFANIDDDLKALVRVQKSVVEGLDFTLNRLLNANEITDEESLPTLTIDDLTKEDMFGHHRDLAAENVTDAEIEADVQKMLEELNAVGAKTS